MELSTAMLKAQIRMLKPIANKCSVALARSAQDKMGELMSRPHKDDVTELDHDFGWFKSSWIIAGNKKCDGVVLYLHGGGYVTGGLEYCRGFGTVLASSAGIDVLCVAYRLAPENPHPAALQDALSAYDYLISLGYPSEKIILCGESAGGGLIYSLSLKLKELERSQPGAIIAISPWTDLSCSGASHIKNAESDPSLTTARLLEQAEMYSDDLKNPYVSPLFADLQGLARSLIFVGSDEILLDDSVNMYNKLTESKCNSKLIIREDMWHAYILFGIKEANEDICEIVELIREVTGGIS